MSIAFDQIINIKRNFIANNQQNVGFGSWTKKVISFEVFSITKSDAGASWPKNSEPKFYFYK